MTVIFVELFVKATSTLQLLYDKILSGCQSFCMVQESYLNGFEFR